jgi:hypothetical protein
MVVARLPPVSLPASPGQDMHFPSLPPSSEGPKLSNISTVDHRVPQSLYTGPGHLLKTQAVSKFPKTPTNC